MFSAKSELRRVDTLLVKGRSLDTRARYSEDDLSFNSDPLSIVSRLLIHAGIGRQGGLVILGRLIVVFALIFLLFLATQRIILFVIPLIAGFIEYARIKAKIRKRVKLFEQDYAALLLSLASSIKTGADPLFALSRAADLFPPNSVMAEEISAFRSDIERGLGEDKSLKRFGWSIACPDLELFRMSMILARREGSSLGECLQRLARVSRQRQSFARKVRSAVAMQKLAATGIAGCAVVIGLIQYFSTREALVTAWNHPLGHKVMIVGVSLLGLGIIWMRRLSSRTM